MNIKKTACLLLVQSLFLTALYAQVKPAPKASGPETPSSRGKIVFSKICIACHMADGMGVPKFNPPLSNTPYVLGDKTRLIKIVLNGFKEKVKINGQSYSNIMTPHKDLNDQQIADVLTYVRSSFGNKASAVSMAEVKKVRAMN